MQEEHLISDKKNETVPDVFSDVRYICNSTSLILDSLKKGMDVAQLPSGDVIVTEVKVVNTQYSWNKEKRKMIRISQI
ncbi:MAG: DUF2671 domain-containing protein [Rickettsia sp.]|nr:DUF2671 domain-containing protein [Rickettsia sp.]